jgi:hypothetical protein
MSNSSIGNDCVEVPGIQMLWNDLQQFCLFNKKVSMLGIAK